jgi:hypothetical protein
MMAEGSRVDHRMSENAWSKVAQAVIRLVAFALCIVSVLLYLSDLEAALTQRQLSRPAILLLKGIPFLLGLILAFKSQALAARFTKDLD